MIKADRFSQRRLLHKFMRPSATINCFLLFKALFRLDISPAQVTLCKMLTYGLFGALLSPMLKLGFLLNLILVFYSNLEIP